MNYTYDRTAAELLTQHPLLRKMERAVKLIGTLQKSIERDGKAFTNQMGYNGDSDKAILTVNRICEKADKASDIFEGVRKDMESFLSERAREPMDYYTDVDFERLDGDWHALKKTVWVVDSQTPQLQNAAGLSRWSCDTLLDAVRTLAQRMGSMVERLRFHTRPKLDAPKQYEREAMPGKKLEGFLTPQVMGVVKTMARKFGKDPAACATLGILVLEDVNAHAANRAIEPLVGHYENQMRSNPDLYDKLQSVVGSIGSAFQWDIIRSAAFMVGIMRLTGCPEAGVVADKIGRLYESEGVFN